MATRGFQSSFNAGVLSPVVHMRPDLDKYRSGCSELKNMLIMPQGGASKRPGFRFISEIEGDARLIPFIYNESQYFVLIFTEYKMFVSTADGLIMAGNEIYYVPTGISLAAAKTMTYAQCADIMYLAHADMPPQKLSRYGNTDWRLQAVNFTPPPAPTRALSVAINTTGEQNITFAYCYTYVDEKGNESLPGGEWTGEAKTFRYAGDHVNVSIPAIEGATEYRVYKMYAGSYGYIGGVLPENINKVFVDENITPNAAIGVPVDTEYFKGAYNYPSQVAFYQQRLIFAASYNQPQTVWMSKAGNFENFSKKIPITDEDSIEITMASNEASMITWLICLRSLVLGSGSGIWEIAGNDQIVSPTKMSATPQNYTSCANVRPVVVGNAILFVLRGGRKVYELAYDFGSDSYKDGDITLLAPHLFEGVHIQGMVYQETPYSMVWCVMSDGTLRSLTYMPEQRVNAWASHDTQGLFKDLCVLPGDGQQSLFALVKRGEKYFLEKMENVFEHQDITEAFFVDSGLSRNGTSAIGYVSGLAHLEGMNVQVLADGMALPDKTVEGGGFYLDRNQEYDHNAEYKIIHAGLGYEARLATMPLQITDGSTSTFGMIKRIHSVHAMFHKTVGCKVGPGRNKLDSLAFRTDENYDAPVEPQTVDIMKFLNSGWRERQIIYFVSDQPLPLTMLGIAPVFDVN